MYLLDDEQGLPPKSKTTLGKLEVQKSLLSVELSVCIRDWACHNKEHANDYMCAFVCTIYDILREDYSNKIFFSNVTDSAAQLPLCTES